MPTDRDDPACIVTSDDAIALLEQHDLRAVMIVAIRKDGVIDLATDGQDPWTKDVIASYGNAVLSQTFSTVPMRTAFGVGNGGVPKRVSEPELGVLAQDVRAWVVANTHPKAVP